MRIILFTGKGGVGKSSIASATAVRLAVLGRKTLIVSSDLAHNLSDIFDQPVGDTPKLLTDNLHALEVDVLKEIRGDAMAEYSSGFLAYLGMENAVAEEVVLVPGVDEICLLLRILREVEGGSYETVVIDCPPTGAMFRLLTLSDSAMSKLVKMVEIERKLVKVFRPIGKRMRSLREIYPEDRLYECFAAVLGEVGRLGDLRGHKDVYLIGFGIFGIASVLCGLAGSALTLSIWRGLQAVGGAMLMANSPAILTKSFPAAQRGRALGLQATMTYLGLVTGPSLGGWLTDLFSWRAVFFINIPVVVVAFLLALRFVPRDRGKSDRAEPFDLAGALLFSTGLVLLLLALNQAHNWGWLSLPTLGLLAASAFLLAGFVRVEKRTAHPMLDLTLFRRLNFSAATTSAVLNYVAIYSIIFVLPFYLIQGRSFSPSAAGILLTSQPLIMMVAAPLSGWLSDRIGTRLPAILGMIILSVGLFLLSRIGPETQQVYIAVSLAVAGLGTGIFISPNSSALMGAAPRARQGIAAGVLALSRNLGMVLGVGLAGAVLTTVGGAGGEANAALFRGVQTTFLITMVAALLSAGGVWLRKDENQ